MVGGDRRSPPRHKAKGGGGKGKGSGGNEGLGAGFDGSVKSGGATLTGKNAEKFHFGSRPVEEELQQVTGNSDELHCHLLRDGVSCDILKHDPSLGDPTDTMAMSELQPGTPFPCGNSSWAMEVEGCEALQTEMECTGGAGSSVCAMEHSILPSKEVSQRHSCSPLLVRTKLGMEEDPKLLNLHKGEDLQQQFSSSLRVHAMCSSMDNLKSQQAAPDDANARELSSQATGMDCIELSPTTEVIFNSSVNHSLHGLNCDVDGWKNKKSVENGDANSSDIQKKYNRTQGVCPMVSIEQCAANACVNSGILKEGKSANTEPLHPANPNGLYASTGDFSKQILNGKAGNLHGKGYVLGASVVPRSIPQSSNVWKKPEHMRVDENDLKHISVDGRSLAFDVDTYEANKVKLEKGLIGKIIGRKLPLHILDQELSRRWGFVGGFRTILLSGDYFLCIFESMEARDTILLGGPWQILGHIIGLDKWSPEFNSDGLNGLSSPIWVRLPKLPLLFWDKKTISRIGAMIGKPLWIDAQTTIWGRCEYARVCVRMDLSKRLPTGVWIQEYSSRFFQPIEYEGITLLCFHCGIVGHKAVSCPNTHKCGTNSVDGTVHSSVETMIGNEISKNMKNAKLSDSGPSKEADSSHLEKPSMARTTGLTTQVDTLEGEKDYGPWILVTRKRKPVRNSGKFQPSNFCSPPADPIAVVPPSMDALENDGLVDESVPKDHGLKTLVNSSATVSSQPLAGSPPHHDTTTLVANLEATTSRQPRSRSGKERVSKAHFEKELLQLGPIALKSRKRKNKVTIAEAEQCLKDFTQASNSGGGDASPSRGK